jgi:hypothetical protein
MITPPAGIYTTFWIFRTGGEYARDGYWQNGSLAGTAIKYQGNNA